MRALIAILLVAAPVYADVPTPPSVSEESPAVYPAALVAERLSGEVLLELLIDERGAVTETRVVSSPHPAFEASALKAVTTLRFRPARAGDEAIAARIQYAYRFELPSPPPREPRAVLAGKVLSKGTRRPIAGAALLDATGRLVAETDATGRFRASLAPGTHALSIVATAFDATPLQETLREDETLEVLYRLQPHEVNPYEVTVRAPVERVEVARIELAGAELREVPGTMGDPFRVLMLMPGVASIGAGVSYPIVRGSQPAATGYLLDGVRVPMLFHLLLGPAVVHPEFIDSIDFHPGAAPANYGRILGGVVDGKLSRPHEDRLHASAYADLLNAGGFLELPIESTGTNITLAGRFSYSAFLTALVASALEEPLPDGSEPERWVANFWDYQLRVEQKVGAGKLRLFVFGSSDRVDASPKDGFLPSADTGFHRADLRLRHPLAGGELEVATTAASDGLQFLADDHGVRVGEISALQNSFSARANWKRDLAPSLGLQVGADVEHRRGRTVIRGVEPTIPGEAASDQLREPESIGLFAGAFAQAIWRPSPRWTLVPGVRVDHYSLPPSTRALAVEPRLSVLHGYSDRLLFKAGAGLFHQPPTVLVHLPVAELTGLRYGLQRALQFDVGFEWRLDSGYQVSADAYFNPLLRTVEFDPIQVVMQRRRAGLPETIDPASSGHAYGFELMVRRPLGRRWFGWVSYAYQRSVRQQRFYRFDAHNRIIGTAEELVPFAFEQAHVFNAAVSWKLGNGWTVGGNLHFNTGRPETGQLSSRTRRWGTDETGRPAWVRVDLDEADRLPACFRLDARVAKAWTFDEFTLEAYLDVYNLSVTHEVLSYDYRVTGTNPWKQPADAGLIVLPMLGVKGTY